MHLTELKNTPVSDLVKLGEEQMGLENLARLRKQDIVFAILKQHAKSGEDICGGGVLEILPDGFGFLRSADSSYLAGPDDIYVSPSQIRRFPTRFMSRKSLMYTISACTNTFIAILCPVSHAVVSYRSFLT